MAQKPKNRKKAYKPKVVHGNNLHSTGLFNRRTEASIAIGRLEAMSDLERQHLMVSLHSDYGKQYFRINVLQGSYEKVGNDIELYMQMALFWDIVITIYSLPEGTAQDGMDLTNLDHYELFYKHRQPVTLSAIRSLPVEIATNFIDKGTEPFMIRIDCIPVLPILKQGEEPSPDISPEEYTHVNYWYDPTIPANAEFKHRPRTCDKTNGWSMRKYEENQNAILRKLVQCRSNRNKTTS